RALPAALPIVEAADTAQSPSDFLRQVFGRTEDAAAADLRHETEDPVVLNAPDPAAALQERDAQRQERAAIFAAELLNDPATPAAIKERVASFGGDFSSREAQEFVARNLVALRAGEKLRSEEHTSELQSRENLVCRLLLEK